MPHIFVGMIGSTLACKDAQCDTTNFLGWGIQQHLPEELV